MLYCDVRLPSDSRYILAAEALKLVWVPDEIRKCVAFVGFRKRNGMIILGGTAFFIIRPIYGTQYTFEYIVTAKHVIDEIRAQGGDKVLLRINTVDGSAKWVESDINQWRSHPDELEVDVAVCKTIIPDIFDNRYFPIASCATDEVIKRAGIGPGDEVCMPGLFIHHYGEQRNVPIIRIGNIAAMPEEKVQSGYGQIDAYLIEARSIGGLSGSPVFVSIPVSGEPAEIPYAEPQTAFYLLGLMQGHWKDTLSKADSILNARPDIERVNMGIGIVVPVVKILEVINQPIYEQQEKKEEQEIRKRNLPVMD